MDGNILKSEKNKKCNRSNTRDAALALTTPKCAALVGTDSFATGRHAPHLSEKVQKQ